FFIAQKHSEQAKTLAREKNIFVDIRLLDLKTFEHTPLAACYTNVTRDALALKDTFAQKDITTYESDIRLAERYLMERFLKGSIEFTGNVTCTNCYQRVQNAKR
ncbi:DNA polymerase II, partial [Vibrio parahaemolyticus]|nr:DNA polymerase II [Vibrio parahaemolyticus]